jgi:DNA polymerase-3 subunit gamma/tau
LDVLEIDGASNNGVEQVRDLRDNARYLPARGPYKIFIIDEVHMLTINAFNALLKTLEEPPPHVKFVLATTEPQKVPATIASRCQRFDLRRIAAPAITRHLARIAEREGVEIAGDALLAIARGAEGGLRDAESALDQLMAFCSGKIEEADVLSIFGLASRRKLDELGGAILDGNVVRLLEAVDDLDRHGKDLSRLLAELIEWFRNLLVMLCGETAAAALDLTDAQRETFGAHAARADRDRVLRIVETLIEADTRLRYALSRRVLLETALFQCARAATTASLPELLRELNRLKDHLGRGGEANPSSPPSAPTGPMVVAEPSASMDRTDLPASEPANTAEGGSVPPAAASAAAGPAALETVWRTAVERAVTVAPELRLPLGRGRLVSATAEEACVVFEPGVEESRRACEEPMFRKAIQNALRRALGKPVRVRFELGPGTGPASVVPSEAGPPEATAPPAETTREKGEDALRRKNLNDPAVRNVLEMFEGTITDIRT